MVILPGIDKKRTWVVQEILREFEKQVFAEGTSYEGSTSYHVLMTELFYHAHLLFEEMNIHIPEHFHTTLLRMFDFINWCTVNDGAMVAIGDNDSGKVLYYGLTRTIIAQMQTPLSTASIDDPQYSAYFAQFGLSIIQTNNWHITLRHHAYNALQPSGHFHNDVGSITLTVDGIPVIIDPGSFVYTASAMWRNYFRSVAVHNTSLIADIEPVPLSDGLFVLHVPERSVSEVPRVHNNSITLHAQHALYERLGLHFTRCVEVNDNRIQINDLWIGNVQQKFTCSWNFTLASDIVAHTHDNGVLLTYHQKPLLMMQSDDVALYVA